MTRTRLLLILDTILFLLFALLFQPRVGGLTIHEWVGFAAVPLVVVHVLCEWRWLAATMAKFKTAGTWRLRIDFLLIVLLFVSFVVTAFSGAMTSLVALPSIGLATTDYEVWRRLHNEWQVYLLILTSMHIAMNWSWVLRTIQRHIFIRKTVEGATAIGTELHPKK